jgi:hypothetical protein
MSVEFQHQSFDQSGRGSGAKGGPF